MFERFRGFHEPPEGDLKSLWNTATFTFDANVLLDVYRVPGVFEKLSSFEARLRDRVFIPFQFALEFHRNLDEELRKVRQRNENVTTSLARATNIYISEINKSVNPVVRASELRKSIESAVAGFASNIEAELPAIRSRTDERFSDVTTFLNRLLESRIGDGYARDTLWGIYDEGRRRYASLIPPGFEDVNDKSTDERRFGDLVGWMQMLDYARDKKTPLILVTEDTKPDWWIKKKDSQPHPYLVQEMADLAGQPYYQYNLDAFLRRASLEFDEQPPSEDLLLNLKAVRRDHLEDSAVSEALRKLLRDAGARSVTITYAGGGKWISRPTTVELSDDEKREIIEDKIRGDIRYDNIPDEDENGDDDHDGDDESG